LADDNLTKERFDQLLEWLSPDRNNAAKKYESIRSRLIKIFVSRGLDTADEAADETINRVARKVSEIRTRYQGDPAYYFYRVGSFIARETLRKEDRHRRALSQVQPSTSVDDEEEYEQLQECLKKLVSSERDLVLRYYQLENQSKIDHRRKIAEEMGLTRNALAIRACRIRSELLKCVELYRRTSSGF
jgi:DNA-directed RNA polymerase specialized sigma24 family protein